MISLCNLLFRELVLEELNISSVLSLSSFVFEPLGVYSSFEDLCEDSPFNSSLFLDLLESTSPTLTLDNESDRLEMLVDLRCFKPLLGLEEEPVP